MAGIYIHIPYCRKACIYCNFHFSTSLGSMHDMVDAIRMEMKSRKGEAVKETETVYFGGGTPGMLEPSLLAGILSEAGAHYEISAGAEITLEANPDDINPSSLTAWKQAGINRLSIGIQSFDDNELAWMNRSHSAEGSVQALRQIRDAGFDNFSTDLIFGSPLSGNNMPEKNIDQLLEFDVPHISCYALTAEPRTRLFRMIREKASPAPDEDLQAGQFLYIMERLKAEGYEHYEISNFAKPGWRSRHNSSYWKGVPYLGFGPSAHSFDGAATRSFNIADNRLYIESATRGIRSSEIETLTPAQQLNESVMIGLRTQEGLDLESVREKFGAAHRSRLLQSAEKYLGSGAVLMSGNFLLLSDKGKLMADRIASDLFCDNEKSSTEA